MISIRSQKEQLKFTIVDRIVEHDEKVPTPQPQVRDDENLLQRTSLRHCLKLP